MRVATLCFSRTVGGLELAVLRRGAELKARGHEVLAVLPDAPGLQREAERLGLAFRGPSTRLHPVDPIAVVKLRRILRRAGIQVVLVARSQDLAMAILGAGRKIAVVLYQQMQSGVDKHDLYHSFIYRRLDGAIAITEALRRQLLRRTCLASAKISVVRHGVDPKRFFPEAVSRAEARARFDLPAGAFVAGIIGGLDPRKGQREFLEALALAAESDSALGARLVGLVVGGERKEHAAYARSLRELRDSLPIRDRVHFIPFQEDPRPAFRALDVFVLASHGETFGMVLQEALALGVPVIATNAGGVPEIIAGEDNGLLVPAGDAPAIAAAIVRLFRDPELRERLARRGREFVLAEYEPGCQATAFEEALRAAVERRAER